MVVTSSLVTLLCMIVVSGFKAGGPVSLCNDPYPHHHTADGDVMMSSRPSPYTMILSQTTYSPGDLVSVKMVGGHIRGFQVAAHTVGGRWDVLYGEFVNVSSQYNTYRFYSDSVNCVSHSDKYHGSTEVQLYWRAPLQSVGDVIISATVVEDYKTFWANVSIPLKAIEAANVTKLPAPLQINAGDFDPELDLGSCLTSCGCVKYPAGCSVDSCVYSITFRSEPESVRFRLSSKMSSGLNFYVALGISEDQRMERDETFTCMLLGGTFRFIQGYNPDKYNTKQRSDSAKDVALRGLDGFLSCEFTIPLEHGIEFYGKAGKVNISVDYRKAISEPSYYLYLAWGDTYIGSQESAAVHKELPIVSQLKVKFNSEYSGIFYSLPDLVKVHATLMLVAWFVLVAIAMVIARYYRNGFASQADMCCGLKAWFQLHRGMMISAAFMMAASFIIIFVHVNGFSTRHALHAGFGIATIALTCIQILMGFLRPDVDAGKRRIAFNWIHRLSGVASYICATVCMFLGSKMDYMHRQLQEQGTGLLAGLVAVHIVTAILLELLECRYVLSSKQTHNGHASNGNNMEISEKEDKPKAVRLFTTSAAVLAVYISLVLTLTVCFLTVLWFY